jgi:hypothetical protein
LIAFLVFLVGVGLVTAGAALIFVPAGFLVSGVALIAGAWFYVRGARVVA